MAFRPTTIVAGTTKAIIAVKIPARYFPTPMTPPRVPVADPAYAAKTRTIATIRYSFVSLPVSTVT